MARPKTTVRVSLKSGGKTTRLNIIRLLDGRFVVYRDGKRRSSMTATEFGKRVAKWLKCSVDN